MTIKPLLLKFEAIGPFKDEQIIDFTQFEQDGLFLITGKTGAGKSTIFDAISYALFSTLSTDRKNEHHFKSEFAQPEQRCYVQFTFSIKGETYTVERSPEQTQKSSSRDKIVNKKPVAILYKGDNIIAQKISDVNKEIKQLLGVEPVQFKKLFMLSQGEFMEFLKSKSKDKSDILRELFDTDIYNQFAAALKNESKSYNDKIQQTNNEYKSQLSNLQFSTEQIEQLDELLNDHERLNELLNKFVLEQETQINSLKSNIVEYQNNIKKINLPEQTRINEMHSQLSYQISNKQNLDEQKLHYDEIRGKINILSAVEKLNPIILLQKKSKLEYNQKLSDLEQLNLSYNSKQTQHSSLEATLQTATLDYQTNKQLQSQLEQLKAININIMHQSKLFKDIENSEKNLVSHKKNLESYILVKVGLQINDEIIQLQNIANLNNNYLQKLMQSDLKSKQLSDLTHQFYLSQSAIIAQTLNDNEPCPVCGSTEHPHKATNDLVVHQADVDNARSEYDIAYKSTNSAQQELNIAISKSNLEDVTQLNTSITNLQSQLANTTSQQNISKFNIDDVENCISKLQTAISDINAQNVQRNQQLESLGELPSSTQTNNDINQLKTKIDANEKNYNSTLQKFNNSKLEVSNLANNINNLKQYIEDLSAKIEADTINIKNTAEQLNIKSDIFTQYRSQLPELPDLKAELNFYDTNIITTDTKIKTLIEQLNGAEFTDLQPLTDKFNEYTAEINQLNETYLKLQSDYTINRTVLGNLTTLNSTLSSFHKQFADIISLSDVASGSNNLKITFECFVQIQFFELVLQKSNLRLAPMSNNRYQLKRDNAKSTGNGYAGLDLNIFDSYNQSERSVTNLSGGENFIVSLCLALGLADVVMELSGGIRLDTLFIDEGFGSLDVDTLELAIKCLHDLMESGRLIGVISHVTELNTRIHSKILVNQQTSGSTIKTVV